jgi:hypothetical protein
LLLLLAVCAYAGERLTWTELWCHTEPSSIYNATGIAHSACTKHTLANVAVALFNLAVVGSANYGFVLATLRLDGRQLTAIQILLAVFKLGFNSAVVPSVQNRVKALGAQHEATMSQLLQVLLNVIGIPCLVVLFISPACFFDALKGPDSVTSSYEYDGDCYSFVPDPKGGVRCDGLVIEEDTTEYTPPFTYSYQCSSSFVTSYAPTYVIMCVISGFVLPAYRLLQFWLRYNLSPTSRLFPLVMAATPRILEELPSPQELAEARSDPLYRPVFYANELLMNMFTYLALILTFGALFPPLAVCCAVAMVSVVLTALLEVGYYMTAATSAGRQDCLNDIENACKGVATFHQLRVALYMVLTVTCMFYTLFLFDTLGYEVGFAGAFWVLLVVPMLPVVIAFVYKAVSVGTAPPKVIERSNPDVGVELGSVKIISEGSSLAAGERTQADQLDSHQFSSTNPMHVP